jgi:hypothetical protein
MRVTRGRLLSAATAVGALCAVLAWSPGVAAQEGRFGKMSERGFGNRDEFVFSVERIFGFQNQDFGGDESYDSLGMHPIYWGDLGFWGVWDTGLTFGGLVGITHFNFDLGDSNSSEATLMLLRPRIGYAGSQNSVLGYWLRAGPTVLWVIDDDGDSQRALALGGEAYAVFTPVPHVGILVGPHAEFHIKGGRTDSGSRPQYSSYGLTMGLMGEFW